jgi:hypothetical protein
MTTTARINRDPDMGPPTDETGLVQCANCGRYGWHTTDRCPGVTPPADIARMTTTTVQINPHLDIAPPAGVVDATAWGDGERIVYGRRYEIGAIVSGAWACQQSDGSLQGNDGHDVYVDEMDERGYQCERLNLSPAEARQLGQALLAAADTADGWVAR